jgi:two-component system chemotaxis response regulator CheB
LGSTLPAAAKIPLPEKSSALTVRSTLVPANVTPFRNLIAKTRAVNAICIGSSTGGPNALSDVFVQMKTRLPVPVLIVQHMPAVFTRMLAERLTRLNCGTQFFEGEDGMPVTAGNAYVAPGGRHMEVQTAGGQQIIRLHDGPAEHSCRPSVDVLFRSVASVYGGNVVAAILTGMGSDGAPGCQQLSRLGAHIIAQDEASSVVWGMPGAVVQKKIADEVLPLSRIGLRLQELARASRVHPSPHEIAL